MSVIFLILPLAIALSGVAIAAFILTTRRGQYDDLDTPPWRMLMNDEKPSRRK